MAPGKKPMAPPEWSQVKALFHLQIKDAAKALGVGEPYLRSLCRKNGIDRWPRQRIRSLVDQLKNLAKEAALRQGAPTGEEARHRPQAMIGKDISDVIEEMARLLQIADPPPGLPEHGGDGTATDVILQGDTGLPTDNSADA